MKLSVGPGALVAAAFIGPGTVTACTVAGANFGYALVWTLVFATISTIILQSMAARLGVVSRIGLGEALMAGAGHPVLKLFIGGLVLLALGLGNAAYESGNLAGGALGAQAFLGHASESQFRAVVLTLSFLSAAALLLGGYKVLEKVLITLVLIMAIAFAISAVLVRPDLKELAGGLVPKVPEGDKGLLTAIALIGTTIVPYNLFLHAATVRKKWQADQPGALSQAISDTQISVGLGGLISIFVMSTAAASLFGQSLEISNAGDMAKAIEPTYGPFARYLVGIGLLAAGFTSAITAPMATAYALTEILGFKDGRKHQLVFKTTALAVLLIGTFVAISGLKPVDIILIAQLANGILLPIIACSLLYAMNKRSLLGDNTNGVLANLLGGGIVLLTFLIGARLVLRTFGIWP
jgi:Mn2+ and Fe2+ transporters of the NRAMP family